MLSVFCILYFKKWDGVTDVSLQSIWAKQQWISSFSSSKDGITDVFLQVYKQNNKELVVFRVVKNKREKF